MQFHSGVTVVVELNGSASGTNVIGRGVKGRSGERFTQAVNACL
jgi:hypothetical protein